MSAILAKARVGRSAVAQKSLQERKSNEELEDLLEQLAKLLDRTKILYEQYFMGIQKLPPSQLHKDIERRIRDLTQENIRNTALRYKLTNIKQKFGSYNTYWRRILREIDKGTYIRDVARAGRRAVRRGEDLAPELLAAMPQRMRDRILRDRDLVRSKVEREQARGGAADAETSPRPDSSGRKPGNVHHIDDLDLGGDFDLDAMFDAITSEGPGTLNAEPKAPVSTKAPALAKAPIATKVPIATKAPAAAKPPPPKRPATPPPMRPPTPPARAKARASSAAAPPPGMSESDARNLYRDFVRAKQRVGERTDHLSYEKLMRSLNQQAPGIMSKHKAQGVNFGVVIKDDRVVLKAKPKK